MDVFIKSFNRPYYLDRCIQSIGRFLQGHYRIHVLDDGTSPEYLDIIRQKHPDVVIHLSPGSPGKINSIRDHVQGLNQYTRTDLPVEFWKEQISETKGEFLLLEEDAWLTSSIDIGTTLQTMRRHNIVITKLHWGNCSKMLGKKQESVSKDIQVLTPDLPVNSLPVLRPLLRNTLKIKSALKKAKLLKPEFLLPYYTLYTVSSAFFERDFWLYAWRNASPAVQEEEQLLRAVMFHHTNPTKQYGSFKEEMVKTSYITSSGNTFRSVSFDMIAFNEIISDAWSRGKVDSLKGFPNDFPVEYLQTFLPERGNYTPEHWKAWIHAFKGQFELLGITTT